MKTLILSITLFLGSFQFSTAQCSEKVLEGFGGISAIAIYNTYVTIGAIADGYDSEVYDSEYVGQLMDEQTGMIGVVSGFLQACVDDNSSGSLVQDDKDYLSSLIQCLDYLNSEAASLKAYASGGSEDDLADYYVHRENAWNLIAELLDLE